MMKIYDEIYFYEELEQVFARGEGILPIVNLSDSFWLGFAEKMIPAERQLPKFYEEFPLTKSYGLKRVESELSTFLPREMTNFQAFTSNLDEDFGVKEARDNGFAEADLFEGEIPMTTWQEGDKTLFPYTLAAALESIGEKGRSEVQNIYSGSDVAFNESTALFGNGEREMKKEIHIHQTLPAIQVEFSGNINKEADFELLLQNLQKRLAEEMAAATDFSYSL